MLLQAIGAALPAALAIALSPFPIIAIVLILAGRHGRRAGALFAAGWVVGIALVTLLAVVVFGSADDPDTTTSALADWGRVLAGAGLVTLGLRKWRQRPRPGDEVTPPKWMASLDDVSPAKALFLGVVLSGANPKNLVLAASAATSMVEAGVHGGDKVVAVVIFVVLASCTVLGAVVVAGAGGRRGAALLDAVRQFMVANSVAITVVILLILGANVLGDGLTGLGR